MAWKNFRIEQKIGNDWQTIRVVDNSEEFRRLVLPLGNVKADKLRIVSENEKLAGGICEIRVYNEPLHEPNTALRAYETMKQPDHEVLLPWEK